MVTVSKFHLDYMKRTVVCATIAILALVFGLVFCRSVIFPNEIFMGLSGQDVLDAGEQSDLVADCDVCVAIVMGDDGSNSPSEKNLPFPLLSRLFLTVKRITKQAEGDKVVCVGVDYSDIVCRIVRDELGEDANCWKFEEMLQRETPVICKDMVIGNTSQHHPQLTPSGNLHVGSFKWRKMHVVDFDAAALGSHAPAVASIRPTIVTAFSANHLSVGMLLLRSIGKAAFSAWKRNPSFNVSVVVWTMEEFKGKDRDDFRCVLSELENKWKLDVEVRRFKFWMYPKWMRINQAHDGMNQFGTGEYAWKVVMIHAVLSERRLVLWQDGGNRFRSAESLTETLDYITRNGFASRTSSGCISDWTRWEAILYLRATELNMSQRNCDASAVGFTLQKYEELARPWYECAITRQCIAPDGSSRLNHRQDQAALTILTYLSNNTCTGIHRDIGVHMDYNVSDTEGADPTSCYSDPRQSRSL
ncbi:uncharacterized protein [Physcomitrium patens]|uniref:uncharacterized protein n=1 Tax=Physcomitrium patens TaxID=3218 RepID=UPI0001621026|nr:uncharacterized protein LOC112289527 [Physcomitrium patens]|eukprot:XP_024390547.1 uncharacterized protein LOC112289527 [Physcomitrella patens]